MWTHAWPDGEETMLVGIERTDKFDNCALAVGFSDEEFRTIEASLDQVLH